MNNKGPTTKPSSQDFSGQTLKLQWDEAAAEELPSIYANQMFLSITSTEVVLVFGDARPPVTLDNVAQRKDQAVTIKPLTRIVVSNEAMKAFAALINRHWVADADE